MGQIFKRITKILKSETTYKTPFSIYGSVESDILTEFDSDNDLRKNIDELNKDNNINLNNPERNFDSNIKMNYETALKILGLDDCASIDEIKTAYKKKITEYHPDKVANLGEELKELADRKTKELNLAYEIIKRKINF